MSKLSPQILVIIPARAGSLGIPGKNLCSVGGKPLVCRSIEASLGATIPARTVVSTDGAEIARVAHAAGAEVIRRPPELATCDAPSELTLLHTLEALEREEGYRPDLVLMIQCTSPFLLRQHIDEGVEQFLDQGHDCCFTGFRSYQFLWRPSSSDGWAGVNHTSAQRDRRQILDLEIVENGAFYLFRRAGFLRARHRFFGQCGCYEMPKIRSLEIDTPDDLALARAMATDLDTQNHSQPTAYTTLGALNQAM
jgi:N-acylneuraminate cytidylyltransferase